jgi:hypothetical protein
VPQFKSGSITVKLTLNAAFTASAKIGSARLV